MMAERYVYVLNSGQTASTTLNYTYAQRGDAFPDKAFSNCPVNPIIKTTGTESEELGASANFFEIRKHPGGTEPTISSDTYTQVVNRKYPTSTSLSDYGKNMEQTLSYKIRTEKGGEGTLLAGSDGLSPTVDLDEYDWFVLINPEITGAGGIPSINPHFARIKQLTTYDKYADGFEFEPRYSGPITKDTNYELYRGPSTTDTSVVAVSYGLRGFRADSSPDGGVTDKYDISNTASIPTWYFYEDKLEKKNQLDYNTKYLLTSCRWFSALTSRGTTTGTVPIAYGTTKNLYTTADMSSYFIKGQSVWRTTDGAFIGNVANTGGTGPTYYITLDECRRTITSSQTIAEGKTLHQTVFRTEREYGTIINDLGRFNLDAKLIDVVYDTDTTSKDYEYNTSVTFDPTVWKDSFRNHIRQLVDRNSSNAYYAPNNNYTHLTANLTGAKRVIYYKSAKGKNNIVSPVIDAVSNDTISRISQNTRVKTLDHSGMQHVKLKEDQSLMIRNSVCTGGIKTFGEYKIPFTATSSTVDVLGTDHYYITLNQLTEGFDYRDDSFLKLGDILRVGEYYYVISSPLIAPDTTARTQKIEVNAKKKLYDTKFATITSMESFTDANVFTRNWKGVLVDDTPIDTEVEYETNAFNRLTINGNTIDKIKTSLYNTRLTLLEPQFSGIETPVDYGDSKTGLVKLQEPTKEFYKPNTTLPFLYYTTGNYTIDEDIFTGLIESTASENMAGVLSWTIEGRDNLNSKLITNYITKNLEQSSDIVYSTITPSNSYTNYSLANPTNAGTSVIYVDGDETAKFKKYDLVYSTGGILLGEVTTDTYDSNTEVTTLNLKDPLPIAAATSVNVVHLSDANFITATKALLSQNKSSTVYPTDFSAAGDKGVAFHDGLKLTYGLSEPTTSSLVSTSATGSSLQDDSIGYDLTGIKGISANKDSEFAFKAALEKGIETDYNTIHTVSSPSYFSIVGSSRQQTGNSTTFSLAPTFPVVLGSVETNTSDARISDINSYLYMVNRNIPAAGFIHTLTDTHTSYYTPNQTFRYMNMQENKEGTIFETHDSIYNDNLGNQKIMGSAPAYRINMLGAKVSPTITKTLKPREGSNIIDSDYDRYTADFGGRIPVTYGSGKTPIKVNELQNIDYRCKNYELMAVGDVYPDSKLRHNNIGKMTDFSSFGMMLQSNGSIGSTAIEHQNYTGTTKENERNDTDHERVEIIGSSIAPTATRRFGIMRLVEATYDWHFNPIDYESLEKPTNLNKLDYFDYIRFSGGSHSGTNVTIENVNGTTDRIKFDSNTALVVNDYIYLSSNNEVIAKTLVAQTYTANTWYDVVTGSGSNKFELYTVPVSTQSIYSMQIRDFQTYADKNGTGINHMADENDNQISMSEVYMGIPNLEREYFRFANLRNDELGEDPDDFSPHNIFVPLISEVSYNGTAGESDISGGGQDLYYGRNLKVSAFHEANNWGETVPFTHYSRVVNALALRTFNTTDDAVQFKIGRQNHLYDNCTALFKSFKRATRQNPGANPIFTETSSPLELDTDTRYSTYISGTGSNNGETNGLLDEIDQHSLNLMVTKYGDDGKFFNRYDDQLGKEIALLGTKTKTYPMFNDGREVPDMGDGITFGSNYWTLYGTVAQHIYNVHRSNHNQIGLETAQGDLYQTQMAIKPKFFTDNGTITNGNEIEFELNETSTHKWLSFVPSLVGHYLVSERLHNPISFLPSLKENMTYYSAGYPGFTAKIVQHDVDYSGTYVKHKLTLDTDFNTGSFDKYYRLMRVSETTFKNTPDQIEINKMFDTGLKYDNAPVNLTTGEVEETTGDFAALNKGYQEGLYAMYLVLDLDTAHTYIDRRTLTTAQALFTDGESIDLFVTDGKNESRNTFNVASTSTSLKLSYEGELTGNGVVSFGEVFTVDTPKVSKMFAPTKAYIGTTFSIGTDIEKAIEEILEENDVDIDTSGKNVTYTGNIVDETSGTTVTLKQDYQDLEIGDIIYNQSAKLIGKIKTRSGTSVTVTNVDDEAADDIFYSPVDGDEITKYDRKPYIDTTRLVDDNVFNAVNFLAAKRGLQYVTQKDKISLQQLSNYKSRRTFSMRYRDSSNLISVDSNTSLFDKFTRVIVIGDNVKAEAKLSLSPDKQHRTHKEINSNIKNVHEAKYEANRILEAHRYPARKISLTMHRKGYELMKPGDIITLNFPNHGIPPDDYTVFEIENVMSSTPQITVGTFNKTIAERLAELAIQGTREQGNLHTVDLTTTISSESVEDYFDLDEQSLKYQLITQSGGTTFGFV